MIKISYLYGVMKSSKTANMLMTAHNYLEKGVQPILIKPEVDSRSGNGTIESRIGIKEKADYIVVNDKHGKERAGYIFETAISNNEPILLDECQFFEESFIKTLCELAHSYNNDSEDISIMAYGLLTNFMGKLFDGSKVWLENADNIREIKTVCAFCNHKAVYNALFKDNKLVVENDSDIVIGDDEYRSLCPYHYLKFKNESLRNWHGD